MRRGARTGAWCDPGTGRSLPSGPQPVKTGRRPSPALTCRPPGRRGTPPRRRPPCPPAAADPRNPAGRRDQPGATACGSSAIDRSADRATSRATTASSTGSDASTRRRPAQGEHGRALGTPDRGYRPAARPTPSGLSLMVAIVRHGVAVPSRPTGHEDFPVRRVLPVIGKTHRKGERGPIRYVQAKSHRRRRRSHHRSSPRSSRHSLRPQPSPASKTWHILPADSVADARLAKKVIKRIDPAITRVRLPQRRRGQRRGRAGTSAPRRSQRHARRSGVRVTAGVARSSCSTSESPTARSAVQAPRSAPT